MGRLGGRVLRVLRVELLGWDMEMMTITIKTTTTTTTTMMMMP